MTASTVLRDHSVDEAREVTKLELFFDLVYVFAVTQLSHHLLDHPDARGALETLVLFLAVWWAWNYTAWATNWVYPQQPSVRALMVVLMLISLVMSTAIPDAFGDEAVQFGVAYVSLQLVRSAFMVWAFRGQRMSRNYTQLLAWSAIAGVPWVAGALVDDTDARLLLWTVALGLDYGAPMHGFRLPALGSTPMRDWTLAGDHLAERMQLVLLVALGESIVVLGATFTGLDERTTAVVAAFVIGFLVTAALWWVYFVGYAEAGARAVHSAADPAALARAGYAYAHAIMVAGVIVVAVGIDRTIHHPTGSTATETAWVILAGPAIYLAGIALFKYTLWKRIPWPPLIGITALALLALPAIAVNPLVLSAAAALVTVTLALTAATPDRLPQGALR
jgi:low temperature requirement protein LtrA